MNIHQNEMHTQIILRDANPSVLRLAIQSQQQLGKGGLAAAWKSSQHKQSVCDGGGLC